LEGGIPYADLMARLTLTAHLKNEAADYNKKRIINRRMSDIEDSDYTDGEYGSDYDEDGSTCSGSGSTSGESFSSFAAMLAQAAEQFESLDREIDGVLNRVQRLDQPMIGVALATFVNPRVLEAAPFRSEVFQLTEEARTMFGIQGSGTVTFARLCAVLREKKPEVPLLDSLMEMERWIV
jgi:hypothetical protein